MKCPICLNDLSLVDESERPTNSLSSIRRRYYECPHCPEVLDVIIDTPAAPRPIYFPTIKPKDRKQIADALDELAREAYMYDENYLYDEQPDLEQVLTDEFCQMYVDGEYNASLGSVTDMACFRDDALRVLCIFRLPIVRLRQRLRVEFAMMADCELVDDGSEIADQIKRHLPLHRMQQLMSEADVEMITVYDKATDAILWEY